MRRKLLLLLLVCVPVIAAAAWAAWQPIRIWWHERQMVATYQAALAGEEGWLGSDPLADSDAHRDALVDLGHYRRIDVPLENVKIRTGAYDELMRVLNELEPVRPLWEIPFRNPVVVELWVEPADEHRWRQAILEVDAAAGDDAD